MKHIDYYLDVIQQSKTESTGGSTGGITPSGTKEISIVQNGESTEDVTRYASAHIVVDVPMPEPPTGVKEISVTKNGVSTHDVSAFAQAEVTVAVPEPAGEKQITTNGKHDVKAFASVDVNVPSDGITPTGTKEITSNGTHDVTQYAQAKVNVPIPAEPAGTKDITENGVHDIKAFANVNVQVPVGVTPQGTKEISVTENGEKTEDVTNFKSVHIVTNVQSSGGGVQQEKYDSLLNAMNGKVTETNFVNEDMTRVPDYLFSDNIKTVSYSLPNVEKVGDYAFSFTEFYMSNAKVTEIHLPMTKSIGKGCFKGCLRLETLEVPNVKTIAGPNTFSNCNSLEKLIAPKLDTYSLQAFQHDRKPPIKLLDILGGNGQLDVTDLTSLQTLIIRRTDKVSPLYGSISAQNIYVADNLVEQYKTATNWSKHADKIKPLSTYVEV